MDSQQQTFNARRKIDENLSNAEKNTKSFLEHCIGEKKCLICGNFFIDKLSLGKLQCRYHTGVVDTITKKYTCCGRVVSESELFSTQRKPVLLQYLGGTGNEFGCRRCDHSSTSYCMSLSDSLLVTPKLEKHVNVDDIETFKHAAKEYIVRIEWDVAAFLQTS